jgi:hypothetical protein
MLEVALRRASDAGIELDLRRADMREFTLDEPTDLVICPFRAMLHLPGHDARVQVMRHVGGFLVPGGRFAWTAFRFDPAVAAELDGVWRDEHGVRNKSTYDYAERRIDLSLEDGSTLALWWVEREEWEEAVSESGLEVEALYGWFDRRPFDETSPELVYVARRPR